MSTPTRPTDVVTRPAAQADAEAVAVIWHEGWLDAHVGNVPEALIAVRTESSFHTRAAERVGDTTVAVLGAEVAGFVMVADDEVEQVFVGRGHRGTGVSPALLAEAERLVAAEGHGVAWLAVATGNARARAFYEREGWADDGAIDYPADVAGEPILVACHRYTKTVD